MGTIRNLRRVTTGVPGLDKVLAGGFFESGAYIVQGPPGAGKTILANQICFHQAAQGQRAIYYTLLTEAHDRMLGFLQHLSFFDAAALADRVTYVSGFKVLEAEGLPGVIRSVRELLAGSKPALLVIDGLVSAEEVAPSNTVFKKFIHEIQTLSAMFRCTILLLTNTEAAQRLHAEHTMVDGILELRTSNIHRKPRRTLEVSKFRGTGQLRGTHTLAITGDGIRVRPRIEAVLAESETEPVLGGRDPRRPFGIPTLDAAIGGGIPSATNTLILGPSGIGKTTLGMHFLSAAMAAGEKALFFTFYEKPPQLVAKARRLGLDPFADGVERGDLRVVWQSSVEANIDDIGEALVSAFAAHAPSRVVIDGMHGFQVTADESERIQDFFAALAHHVMARGATLLFTAETRDLLGEPAIQPPFANASRVAQNTIVMRFAELRGRLARVLAVIKMRDSDFDPTLRALTIGERGLEVHGTIGDADHILGGQPRRSPTDAS